MGKMENHHSQEQMLCRTRSVKYREITELTGRKITLSSIGSSEPRS